MRRRGQWRSLIGCIGRLTAQVGATTGLAVVSVALGRAEVRQGGSLV